MIKRVFILFFLVFCNAISALDRDSLSFIENRRIGISWFERGKYLKAINYLEKAHKYSPADSIINSYLYFSYKFMNRGFEKNSLYSGLSQLSKKQFLITAPKPIYSTYYELGCSWYSDGDYNEWNSRNRNEKGVNTHIGLSQNIKNKLLLSHKMIGNFHNGDIELKTSEGEVDTYKEKYRMLCYSPSISFWKNKALSFSLYGHFLYEHYAGIKGATVVYDRYHPIYSDENNRHNWDDRYYKSDYSWNGDRGEKDDFWNDFPPNNDYEDFTITESIDVVTTEETSFDFLVGTSLLYSFLQFQVESEFSYLNYADGNTFQVGAKGIYYPLENLNLYLKLKFYYLWRNVQSQTEIASHNPVVEGLVGFKILPVWWMELSYLYGDIRYYNEEDTRSLYLFGSKPQYRVSVLNIFPIKDKLSINFSYRLIFMEKEYYSLQNSNWVQLLNRSIGHSLTIGLLWKY